MAAVRRSTRLSSISKTPTTTAMQSPSLPLSQLATTPRRSEMWRRRQNTSCISSEDEDNNDCIIVVTENNENSNLLNRMNKTNRRRSAIAAANAITVYVQHVEQELGKTPRSRKKAATPAAKPAKPMPKSEMHNRQRKSIMVHCNSTDDEQEDRKMDVSPPKHCRKQTLQHHLISPTRLLDRLSIDEAESATLAGIPSSSVHMQQELEKTPRSNKKAEKTLTKRALNDRQELVLLDSNNSDDEQNDNKTHVSPPKQRKQQVSEHLISPTRLLDRLSIDERNETEESAPQEPEALSAPSALVESAKEVAQKDQPKPPSVSPKSTKTSSPVRNKYQNARRVLNSAETQNLPGREAQLQELREFFSTHLESRTSGSLYVSGQPGTGKTACLSLLLRAPEFAQRFQRVYINCTSIASVGAVYKKLTAELQLKPTGRTERDHLEAIQRYLCSAKKMLLLVLDEIDQLCSARQAVLYTIFEWPALPGAHILLVGIANSLDLTDRALMRLNARCELKPRLMHFPSYSKQQIVDIFKSRLAEADVLDVFPPVTLQLLAAKVSAVSGDVRRALDIGRRVVEIAEQQKRDGEKEFNMNALDLENRVEDTLKPVQVTQVAAVLNKVYGASQNLDEDIDAAFPLQQKLMLCSLVLMLRNENNKDISMGRLHEVYRRVCGKRNILALDQAEFAGTVDLVETRGILRIMRKKEPRLNKVILQWDEGEVHAALSDKQLIASILSDTACLGK